MSISRICVCGLGKLGLPIAASFANADVHVIGYDLDQSKVDSVLNCGIPNEEPGLAEAVKKAGKKLTATTNAAIAARGTQACIFITPTPSLPDGSFDNKYLVAAISKIAQEVAWDEIAERIKPKPYLFIIASTTTPTSCRAIFYPLLKKLCPRPFHLIYKPEFIALGTVLDDLANPDFALFGVDNYEASQAVSELYEKIVSRASKGKEAFMPHTDAELAKISLNCFITMKISFANQLYMVAERYGADAETILSAIGDDSRVGRKSLRPGMPFGGPCFPRDNKMFIHAAFGTGGDAALAQATDQVNRKIIEHIVRQVPPTGDIGILGMAYKAGSYILEESGGILIRSVLVDMGRTVHCHDPLIDKFDSLETVVKCPTVIVTTTAKEYQEFLFDPDTCVIDPMKVTETARTGKRLKLRRLSAEDSVA